MGDVSAFAGMPSHRRVFPIQASSVVVFVLLSLVAVLSNADDFNGLPGQPPRPQPVEHKLTGTSVTLHWTPLSTDAAPAVDAFEVQFKKTSETTWQTASSSVGKKETTGAMGLNEIQTVSTRADSGQTIADGWFRLSLMFKGASDFDPETATMTDPIPYNASAESVEYQLDQLVNLQFRGTTTHVTRSLADAEGGYTWAIAFYLGTNTVERMKQVLPQNGVLAAEDIPMLVLQRETISAAWTGGGAQVHISERRKGSALGGACESTFPTHAGVTGPNFDSVLMGTPVCEYTVGALVTHTHYQFRVRGHNAIGWGPYSGISEAVRTLRVLRPSTPKAPMLSSRNATGITVWAEPTGDLADGGEPITGWDFQYRRARSNSQWRTFNSGSAQAISPYMDVVRGISATASGLSSDTPFEFRTRARNTVGYSPWSASSEAMSTLPGVADAPDAPIVHESSVEEKKMTIEFFPTSSGRLRGDQIQRYEIQRRSVTAVEMGGVWHDEGHVEAVDAIGRYETQVVHTRADVGQYIVDGTFQLTFNHGGLTDADPEKGTTTKRIAYDASAADVRTAIEALKNVGYLLRVTRSGPDNQGGYAWTVIFDGSNPKTRGNLPPLQPLEDGSISATWTGGGRSVYVLEQVQGTTTTMREKYTHTLSNLLPYTEYETRVRSVGSAGVSAWSAPSAQVRTKPVLQRWLQAPPSSSKGVTLLTGNLNNAPNILDNDFAAGAARGGGYLG